MTGRSDALDPLTAAADRVKGAPDNVARQLAHSDHLYELAEAIGPLPGLETTAELLVEIAGALASIADGSRHPLLAVARITKSRGPTPVRRRQQAAAVLVSELMYRTGKKRSVADAEAAELVSARGVEGKPGEPVAAKTVTNWRTTAGLEVKALLKRYEGFLERKLDSADAEKMAREFTEELLERSIG